MTTKQKQSELTDEQIEARGVVQKAVLDEMIAALGLKNPAALARALETEGPVISQLRSGKMPFTPLYLIAAEELMQNHGHFVGWNIADLKRKLGLRRLGDPTPGTTQG